MMSAVKGLAAGLAMAGGLWWATPASTPVPDYVVWQLVLSASDGQDYVVDTLWSLEDCMDALVARGGRTLGCERTTVTAS